MPNYRVFVTQKREASVIISAENKDKLQIALSAGGELGLLLDHLTLSTSLVQRETTGEVEECTEDEADAVVTGTYEFTACTKET